MLELNPQSTLADRIKAIRHAIFGAGDRGLDAVAEELALPARTWENYEAGVIMPAPILLLFLVATRPNPAWLLHGTGNRFLPLDPPRRFGKTTRFQDN